MLPVPTMHPMQVNTVPKVVLNDPPGLTFSSLTPTACRCARIKTESQSAVHVQYTHRRRRRGGGGQGGGTVPPKKLRKTKIRAKAVGNSGKSNGKFGEKQLKKSGKSNGKFGQKQ